MQVHAATASKKWLPSPTRKFFNLAIIKKERIHRGKIDDEFVLQSIRGQIDILLAKSPINLKDIFKNIEGERKVILIDGAPGSGKSTLAIHITQGWSKGELFQEFTIVILVQLRDPAVQSAKSIADLLPCRNNEMALQLASAITDIDGRGILWVLDGWDEVPTQLQKSSLLRDIIVPSTKSPITLSSVIVTSRPISSGDLSELVTSRIEVLGFSSEEQRQYFTECLKGDTKAVDDLLERLSENPAIEGSCFLPLNASIIAHLYLSDGSLPDTVHGIFSSFVRHFLSRYLYEKLGKRNTNFRVVSLDNLPRKLQGAFNEMCRLAFKGTAQNKVTFSHSDIEAVKDSAVICEMGLLQATPSILSEGQTVYYNFIHLSVQEFLSAVYISKLPASEQISMFNSLFEEQRFSSVFRYYAAITKLRTSRPFLSKLPQWLIPGSITVHMIDLIEKMIEKRSKPILVTLLHCLYEARDLSLCQFVAEQLGNRLYLSDTSLTPVDCLAIGYFLSTVSLTTSNAKEFKVYLDNCSLGDVGTKSLMCSISRHTDPQSTVNRHLNMDLRRNDIHEEGASHIADLLNRTSIMSTHTLKLAGNPIGAKGIKSILNALDPAGVLDLVKNIIYDRSHLLSLFHYLYEAKNLSLCQFVAKQLGNVLYLSGTSLTPVDCLAIGYFLSTVSLTKGTAKNFNVYLENCSLGDAGTKSLMSSISRHTDPHSTVNRLLNMDLRSNDIHEEGASHIADLLNSTSIVSTHTLKLAGNPIGAKGIKTIFNALDPAGVLDLVKNIIHDPSHLFSLFHYLYEVRDHSLCQFVAKQVGNRLSLSGTSLTPVDCLAIGYFLSTVSLTKGTTKNFNVYLENCSLGDAGTKSLMSSISRHTDPHSTVNRHLDMDLRKNDIHEEGASHIADLLNSTSIVSTHTLKLAGNPIGVKGIKSIFNTLDPAGVLDLVKNIIHDHTLLFSLFAYLYEARDLSLCHIVAEQLENKLYLSGTSLTPVDTLAIGYFLSTISLTTSKTKEFRVYLDNCSLGDAGTKSLMCSISRHIDSHSTINRCLEMNLRRNGIHEEGASHIADLLNRNSIVSTLWLDGNPIGANGLETLFNALKQNKTLKELSVTRCEMTDTGVSSLASALDTNNTLKLLYIDRNDEISENGLRFLVEVLCRSSQLVYLVIPSHLRVDKVRRTINEARWRSRLATIRVNGKYTLTCNYCYHGN